MPLSSSVCDREYDKFALNDSGQTAVRTVTEGTLTGEIVPSGLKNGGRVTEVTINSAGWTALPATALTDRNAIGVQNLSGQEIKINFDNSVSGYIGMVVADGSERQYDITDAIIVYARSQSGTAVVNVEEIS